MQPCDTCGDSYKDRNKGLIAARQEAQRKTDEEKKPFCVCKEGSEYFAAFYGTALANNFYIVEIISRLSSNA